MAPSTSSEQPNSTTKPLDTATQPTVQSTPAPGQKTNTMAIIALILAFIVPLVGLILGIVALAQVKKKNEGGKGLAVASIILSVVLIIGQIIAVTMFWGAIFTAQTELKRQGIDVDTNTGTVNVQDKNGDSASIGKAKIPNGFPSSVPIYPNAKIMLGMKSGTDKFSVVLETTDSKSKVESYYESALQKNGWVNDSQSTTDLGFASGATYTKGSQRLVIVIGQGTSDKATGINLSVSPSQ